MGEVSSRAKSAVTRYCSRKIDADEFKKEIRRLLDDHSNPGNIGRALQKHRTAEWIFDENRAKRVPQLADEVDPRIGEQYDDWAGVWGQNESSRSKKR